MTSAPPRMLGNFTVESEIGSGGMATVYLAEDLKHHRRVAIKVLHPSLTDFTERFIDEARIIAQLDHPNIVPIHDLGENQDGRLFYSMKRIRGVPCAGPSRTARRWCAMGRRCSFTGCSCR